MNILIIDHNINEMGGVERVVQTLADGFARKANVDVISLEKTRKEPFFKYDKKVKRHYILDSTKPLTQSQVFMRKMMRDDIIRTELLKMHDIFDKADVIIIGRPTTANNIFVTVPDLIENKKVIVRDSMNLAYYTDVPRKMMLEFFPKYVDRYIVSSDESIEAYDNFFEKGAVKCVKLYNPLGITPSHADHSKFKTIVTGGRMSDNQKGFDYVIKVIPKVIEKHPDWRFVIYGDGPYKTDFEKMTEKLGVKEYVSMPGASNDVADIYKTAGIFLCLSRYEGYCNALVEAAACGMPCISTNFLMGVEEIIKDKKNGVVVPLEDRYAYARGEENQKDTDNIADAINALIDNQELRKKYSKEAEKIVASRDADLIVDEWFKVIEELNAE